MAHVTLPSFIRSLSGQVGGLCFRTSASGKTTVYLAGKQKRTTAVSENEMQARNLFAQRAKRVNNIMRQDPHITREQAWKIVKQIPE